MKKTQSLKEHTVSEKEKNSEDKNNTAHAMIVMPSYKNDLNLKWYFRRSKLQADKNDQGNLIFPSSSRLSHRTTEEYR